MSLFDIPKKKSKIPAKDIESLKLEGIKTDNLDINIMYLIRRRRLQMLVHSYIYYILNDNIISDDTWTKWGHELKDLQEKYPNESALVKYAEQFKNWTGSTGFDIAVTADPWVVSTATHLLQYSKERKENEIT